MSDQFKDSTGESLEENLAWTQTSHRIWWLQKLHAIPKSRQVIDILRAL
jgi:hypothetical protein